MPKKKRSTTSRDRSSRSKPGSPAGKKKRPRRVPQDAEILNATEAALVLGISERQTVQYAREGVIPATKLDREWRFLRSALRNHIAGKTDDDDLLKQLQKMGLTATVRR